MRNYAFTNGNESRCVTEYERTFLLRVTYICISLEGWQRAGNYDFVDRARLSSINI